jgi:hypothetical protein
MQQLLGELAKQDAAGKIVRAADYNIKPGVKSDEGRGDEQPSMEYNAPPSRKRIACSRSN